MFTIRNICFVLLILGGIGFYYGWFLTHDQDLEQSPEPERHRVVRWRGWGTGLAWWTNHVAQLPPWQQRVIMDSLFSPHLGLGLTVLRYVIPAGYNPEFSPQLQWSPERSVPGYRTSPFEGYDWSADPNQRAFLAWARRYGADVLDATSFSPPWWMTVSKSVAGSMDGDANIAEEYLPLYADYLADITEHFARQWNVTFSTLSPLNEPLDKWWLFNNSQEGCAVNQSHVLPFFHMVRAALDKRGLQNIALSGIDDWVNPSVRFFNDTLALGDSHSLDVIKYIQVHGYSSPTFVNPNVSRIDTYIALRQAAYQAGKEIWQSEWGPINPVPRGLEDLDTALLLARTISEHINFMGVVSWSHWQAVTVCYPYACSNTSASQFGLVRAEWPLNDPRPLFFSKQYFVTMHFSRWIRPGAMVRQMIGERGRFMCVAVDEAKRRLVVVLTNPFRYDTKFTIEKNLTRLVCPHVGPGGGPGGGAAASHRYPASMSVRRFSTSASEDHKLVGDRTLDLCRQDYEVGLKRRSVVTIVIQSHQGGVVAASKRKRRA